MIVWFYFTFIFNFSPQNPVAPPPPALHNTDILEKKHIYIALCSYIFRILICFPTEIDALLEHSHVWKGT